MRPPPLRSCLASLALLAAACAPAEEPPPGCTSDRDCPGGSSCVSGACHEDAPPGDGGGGGGVPTDACDTSRDCLEGEFSVLPPFWWDGTLDGADPVCTVPLRSCPGSVECPVPTECAPAPPGATRLGGMRCERDETCASGRCVDLGEVKVCLRVCETDADCPRTPPHDDPEHGSWPEGGLRCERRVDRNIPVSLCVPVDAAHPGRTLCRTTEDCGTDEGGPPPDGATCRFVGFPGGMSTFVEEDLGHLVHAVPSCDVAPPAASRPTLSSCIFDPGTCAGGACNVACQPGTGGQGTSFCEYAPLRCTQPCAQDDDCPPRSACRPGMEFERIGSWREPFQANDYPGRDIRYCMLAADGCHDELDCCPEPDGQGGCLYGWSPEKKRCAVYLAPASGGPHLLTQCATLDPAKAAPGDCCASHDACDSNLCVPARPGTACEGGGVCSVPCDPDPYPLGAPGSFYDRDR